MAKDVIRIGGAREHNLKNVHLTIPRDKLVVFTGLSGSGKSSLAFDTIYAEGQRKYVESLSAYARQFLDQLKKPEIDFIEGHMLYLPPLRIELRVDLDDEIKNVEVVLDEGVVPEVAYGAGLQIIKSKMSTQGILKGKFHTHFK